MLLTPDYLFSGAAAVTPEFLREHGIRGAGTGCGQLLTAHNSQTLPAPVAAWLEQMKAAGIKLMIVSNNTRKGSRPLRLRWGCPFVSLACKPLPWGIRKAVRRLGVSRREFCPGGGSAVYRPAGRLHWPGFRCWWCGPWRRRSNGYQGAPPPGKALYPPLL